MVRSRHMQAISCQQFLSGLTKCCDPSDLCATSATTASACPVGSETSTADADPNAAQCPELPPGATCSAFVGEHGNLPRTSSCFCHLLHIQSAVSACTQVNVAGRKHAMHVSARQRLWMMVTQTTQLESASITQLQARPVPQAMVRSSILPMPLLALWTLTQAHA